MTLTEATPGLRVVYTGPNVECANKAGVVDRIVKYENVIVIR